MLSTHCFVRGLGGMSGIVACMMMAWCSAPAFGQCLEEHWLPGNGLPGVSGHVYASTVWDADGPGPAPSKLILGGAFSVAVESSAINSELNIAGLVAWDGSRFVPLLPAGTPPNTGQFGTIYSFATMNNGDLIVGGSFTSAAGVTAANIARWNGSVWTPLGAGLNGRVSSLAVLPSGDLVAAGSFTASGATTVGQVARWNGTAWSAFAPGSPTGVTVMLALPNGHLVIGGTFNTPPNGLARWNGTAWQSYPLGVNSVTALALVPGTTDQFYAGGPFFDFVGGGPLKNVARWTGSAWAGLGNGLAGGNVFALAVRPNGEVVVGGQFTTANAFGPHPALSVGNIATWNGTQWSPLDTGVTGDVNTMSVLTSGNVAVGGTFATSGPLASAAVAQWDGTRWSALGNGNGGMYSMIEVPGGDVYTAGAFSNSGGTTTNRIARWDGTRWNAVGPGFNNLAYAVTRLNNGDIVVGGTFTMIATAPQTPAGRIARWNGVAWDNMGGGSLTGGSSINALAVRPTGELIAAGNFTAISGVTATGVARWNSTTGWSALAAGPGGSSINAVIALPDGDVVVGGGFGVIGGISAGNIARWNELTGWTAFISGTVNGPGGTVYGLARASNGDILAAGDFTQLSPVTRRARVARWNGSTWTLLGNESISGVALGYTVLERPDGTIVAGGNFTTMTGTSANYIASWNGTSWSRLEDGMSSHVRALLQHSSGDLWACGLFGFANHIPAAGWARWRCMDVACATDLDDGTGSGTSDGAVTIDDLLYFLVKFEVGDASVDLDNGSGTGTPDGAITIDDLLYFLVRFEAGC
jgi:trimeric autotransporter adhesin